LISGKSAAYRRLVFIPGNIFSWHIFCCPYCAAQVNPVQEATALPIAARQLQQEVPFMKTANTPVQHVVHTMGALLAAAVVSSGCDRPRDTPEQPLEQHTQQQQEPDRDMSVIGDGGEEQEMAQFAMVDRAVAEVQPTANYAVNGTVTFTPADNNSRMNIHIALHGLTPGKHGLHIHQNGDCSAPDAKSAGDHYNPYQASHGAPQNPPHHLGDLGNVEADANGRVDTTVTVAELAFSGPASVLEKAIIVHAQADDFQSQPAGNSGDRVACGVIRQQQEVMADALQE
jgi:Cu-Zn family superoxide dismutase